MPRGDRTGPTGDGAKRGRAAGFCAGFDMPGYANTAIPKGYGMGRNRGWCGLPGSGRGRRQGALALSLQRRGRIGDRPFASRPFTPVPEREVLQNHILALKSELEAIEKRLNQLSAQERESSMTDDG